MRKTYISILLFFMLIGQYAIGQTKPSQEWLDRKFSMFIHFGIYSELGGVWNGEPVQWGYSEQIQSFAGIFSDWYGETANRFNPTYWDPDSIVALAQRAGMKSIVITSKHHDGFCMYDSKYTDYNIVKATPYGRDLIKELAEACKRANMPFGLYFSLIDWHFPQAYPISSHNADPITPEHHEFNKKQVTELLTCYGNISEIWFDMGSLTSKQSRELYDLVSKLQPECMISGRLGNNCSDFSVMPDNVYPNYHLIVPWQTAASMFDETWSYRSWQKRGNPEDKVREKLRSLVQVVGRGGNYLLNIGPMGNGKIVPFEVEVLEKIGQWLRRYSNALYGTQGSPFPHIFEWGEVTIKENNLYLFIKEEFANRQIELKGLKTLPFCGKDLTLNKEVKIEYSSEEGVSIILSKQKNIHDEGGFRVVALFFKETPIILPEQTISSKKLSADNATHLYGQSALDYYCGFKSLIAYRWTLNKINKLVAPIIEYTSSEEGRICHLTIGDAFWKFRLKGGTPKTHQIPKHIHLGKLFEKRGSMVFGIIPEEGKGLINPEGNNRWKEIIPSNSENIYKKHMKERSAIMLLQEIHVNQDCEVAIKLTSGNAAYILLNGKYITAHCEQERIKFQEETLILSLKKGKNQLLVNFYNRYEKEMSYGWEFLPQWNTYRLQLPYTKIQNQGLKEVELKRGDQEPMVTPLRMSSIKIYL